jgi:starch-binding outer membrane protein, SusD/RagB family
MKTRKIATIIFAVMVVVAGVNCKKFLDQKPISTASPETFWKDKSDADTWMSGIYNSLQTTLSTSYIDWGEVRSDNLRVGGTGNAQLTMITNTLSANDADINGITRWTNLYTTISLCNFGIKYLPKMIEKDIGGASASYKEYIGQCYALRALMYFYGLRVWGKLPLHTEPIETLTQPLELPRSSIADVKKRIQDDINESLKTILNTTGLGNAASQKYYMTKGAVYALQTDVHMWFQEYDAALTASQNFMNTVGSNNWVTNITQWKAIFTDPANSPETVFDLYWSSTERGGGIGICSRIGSSSNTNNYEATTDLWLKIKNRTNALGQTIDGRYWAYWDTVAMQTQQQYDDAVAQIGKYFPWKTVPGAGFIFQGNSDCEAKLPIYRYADIMLLRAEALNKKGQYQQALDIVNKVRSRVGYTVQAQLTDYTGDITAGIENTILEERQIELLGEGKRWFDLTRIGKIYDYTDAGYQYLRGIMNPILATRTGAIQFQGENMGRILFPINSDAFNANRKLVGDQNPPYDE